LYVLCVSTVFDGLALGGQWITAVVALVVYYPALKLAFADKQGRELLPMLMISARAQLIVGLVTTITFFTTLR
jgi:ABC-type dipeptide/oligopeptide/nickel transport system permease subunit